MADVNETQVIIAGKVLTLTGYETAEYTQKVANYINKKMDECRNAVSFRSQNKETQMLLVALNIADDYMKISEKLKENEQLIKDKDTEIYNLKHDIITIQGRLDKADDQVRTLQDKMAESSKKLIQLDAKLRTKDKSSRSSDRDDDRLARPEPKAEVKPEPAKPEPQKPEMPKAEAKPEPVKEAPKADSPKAEAPKTDAKPESAKPENAKPENAKPEPVKPESVKSETSKPEALGASKSQPGVGVRSLNGDKDKPIPFPYKK